MSATAVLFRSTLIYTITLDRRLIRYSRVQTILKEESRRFATPPLMDLAYQILSVKNKEHEFNARFFFFFINEVIVFMDRKALKARTLAAINLINLIKD